jgi:multidrug resistance protein, MATE family
VTFRGELKPMLALAGPVVLAEIGWVSMGIVDTVIVGPLGPAAIGAVGIGHVLFLALAVFGMGLLLGLDTLVSHAFGAGRLDECHRWLLHGVVLALISAPILTGVAFLGMSVLPWWGLAPDVLALTTPYLRVIVWSLLPLLLYAAFRRYLQALGFVTPVTVALVSANVINAVAAWALVFGHLGLPAMGTTGSAVATVVSRVYLAAVLVAAAVYYDRRHRVSLFAIAWRPKRRSLLRLLRLGLPAATQVTLELGVFAAASALAGRLDAVSLAAHQVVFQLASLTFMVPLGVASAGAVRVGHAVGRRDGPAAARSGWMALLLGAGLMTLAALVFVLAPRPLIQAFTRDEAIFEVGRRLLLVAGMFQIFDGLQGVSTGVLRGLGDTRTPMLTNLAGHWLLGLPIGYVLCFWCGWGVVGLWAGLSSGLSAIGLTLAMVWRHRIGGLANVEAADRSSRSGEGTAIASWPDR